MKDVYIGDVHGCLDELKLLLDKINYDPASMQLIFLGDLLDRGPKSAETVSFVRGLNPLCVKGNHDFKHTRYYNHVKKEKLSGIKNPMNMPDACVKQNQLLSEEDVKWLTNLPTFIKRDNIIAVHAGLEPKPFDQQKQSKMMFTRFLNEKGKAVSIGADLKQPEGTSVWDESWLGPESVIFGHSVFSLTQPRFLKRENYFTLGIDTGCCFGGNLTAAIYDGDIQFVAVKALNEYHPFKG